MDPDGRKPIPVTDSQWEDISKSLAKLERNLSELITILKNANNDISMVDKKVVKAAQIYLSSDYGSSIYDCQDLADRLTLIKNEVTSLSRNDFKYDSEIDAFAKTMPFFSKTIVLGDKYFAIKPYATKDTKDGTLLHEVSHHSSALLTFDITYENRKMKNLPDYGILAKAYNANNWEYFYETIY